MQEMPYQRGELDRAAADFAAAAAYFLAVSAAVLAAQAVLQCVLGAQSIALAWAGVLLVTRSAVKAVVQWGALRTKQALNRMVLQRLEEQSQPRPSREARQYGESGRQADREQSRPSTTLDKAACAM